MSNETTIDKQIHPLSPGGILGPPADDNTPLQVGVLFITGCTIVGLIILICSCINFHKARTQQTPCTTETSTLNSSNHNSLQPTQQFYGRADNISPPWYKPSRRSFVVAIGGQSETPVSSSSSSFSFPHPINKYRTQNQKSFTESNLESGLSSSIEKSSSTVEKYDLDNSVVSELRSDEETNPISPMLTTAETVINPLELEHHPNLTKHLNSPRIPRTSIPSPLKLNLNQHQLQNLSSMSFNTFPRTQPDFLRTIHRKCEIYPTTKRQNDYVTINNHITIIQAPLRSDSLRFFREYQMDRTAEYFPNSTFPRTRRVEVSRTVSALNEMGINDERNTLKRLRSVKHLNL